MQDITKYVSKDTNNENNLNDFSADFEEYSLDYHDKHDITIDDSLRPESGDYVGWIWSGKRYLGILRSAGNLKDSLFSITQVSQVK